MNERYMLLEIAEKTRVDESKAVFEKIQNLDFSVSEIIKNSLYGIKGLEKHAIELSQSLSDLKSSIKSGNEETKFSKFQDIFLDFEKNLRYLYNPESLNSEEEKLISEIFASRNTKTLGYDEYSIFIEFEEFCQKMLLFLEKYETSNSNEYAKLYYLSSHF